MVGTLRSRVRATAALPTLRGRGRIARDTASKARMPAAVLTAIGGGALLAAGGGRSVVISVGAGEGSGPVIVQIAEPRDVQAMDIVVMPVMVPSNRIIGRLRRDRG